MAASPLRRARADGAADRGPRRRGAPDGVGGALPREGDAGRRAGVGPVRGAVGGAGGVRAVSGGGSRAGGRAHQRARGRLGPHGGGRPDRLDEPHPVPRALRRRAAIHLLPVPRRQLPGSPRPLPRRPRPLRDRGRRESNRRPVRGRPRREPADLGGPARAAHRRGGGVRGRAHPHRRPGARDRADPAQGLGVRAPAAAGAALELRAARCAERSGPPDAPPAAPDHALAGPGGERPAAPGAGAQRRRAAARLEPGPMRAGSAAGDPAAARAARRVSTGPRAVRLRGGRAAQQVRRRPGARPAAETVGPERPRGRRQDPRHDPAGRGAAGRRRRALRGRHLGPPREAVEAVRPGVPGRARPGELALGLHRAGPGRPLAEVGGRLRPDQLPRPAGLPRAEPRPAGGPVLEGGSVRTRSVVGRHLRVLRRETLRRRGAAHLPRRAGGRERPGPLDAAQVDPRGGRRLRLRASAARGGPRRSRPADRPHGGGELDHLVPRSVRAGAGAPPARS
jgi:hypothetical protein